MRWSRGQLVAVGACEQLAVAKRGPSKIERRADLVTGQVPAQRRREAVVEEYAQAALGCLCAARRVLEHRVDLRLRDSWEPAQELRVRASP